MLFITLFLLLVLHNSCGYPDGAPNKHDVCKTLHPHHRHAKSQKTPSPYHIVGKKKIPCGSPVNITISSEPGHQYKGFMMQARPARGRSKPLGNFTITDPAHSKAIGCFGFNNNTVTHNSPELKSSTSFVWMPPPKYKGHVTFHATVVKDFQTFWTDVTGKLELSCSDENDYADSEEEEMEYSSTKEYSEKNSFDYGSFHLSIYDECSVRKMCFGIPDNCVTTRSCDALVTVTPRESQYEFEMLGVPNVAVSFSENGDLNSNSLTACLLVNDADVNLYQTTHNSSDEYQPPNNDLKLINSSFRDGVVYCKFVRDEEVEVNGERFNFRTKKYYILLASANTDLKQAQNETKSDPVKFHASDRKDYLSNVTGFTSSVHVKDYVPRQYGVKQFFFDFILGIIRIVFNTM